MSKKLEQYLHLLREYKDFCETPVSAQNQDQELSEDDLMMVAAAVQHPMPWKQEEEQK